MYIYFHAATIITAVLVLLFVRKHRQAHEIVGIFLLRGLVISVGGLGIFGFVGHAFRASQVAAYIGWPAGNPFQFEIAIANLGMGVLGILCIWFRGNFWIATIIFSAIFGWGAACGHIYQYIVNHNVHPGNIGGPLYDDIVKPIVLIALLIAYSMTKKTDQGRIGF